MAVLTIIVIACVSLLVIPVFVVLCADAKEKEKSKPRLKSVHKKESKAQIFQQSSIKSNGSSHRKIKTGTEEEGTVVANGPAIAAYEEVEGISQSETGVSSPKVINDAITNGAPFSVVDETSPASSQRSSRASNGTQSRVLPDIPGQSAKIPLTNERSPSIKRALPDLPSPGDDEGAGLYDQLQRDVAPHQMRSKSSKSKVPTQLIIVGSDDLDDSDAIEPDEVTRNSIVFSPSPNSNQLSSLACDPPATDDKSAEHSNAATADGTKPKQVRHPYSKVNKEYSSSDKGVKSPGPEASEPVYADPPPVPDKLFNPKDEPAVLGAAAAGVAIVIDDSAQDSGSGYYAMADDGPVLNTVASPAESYDILTARESIASVRARQEEEDYYESMDDKPDGSTAPLIAVNTSFTDSTTEIYAEIDNPSGPPPPPGGNTNRRPTIGGGTGAGPSKLLAPLHVSDPGYERVDFTSTKGEQTDSAGYAIVKESSTAAAAATATNQSVNDDEEDYAVCGDLPSAAGASLAVNSATNVNLSRNGSDVSDYATVSFNDADGTNIEAPQLPPAAPPAAPPAPAAPAAPAAQGEQDSTNGQAKPYQKYKRTKEHLYQEIDEVRDGKKSPPDKKS